MKTFPAWLLLSIIPLQGFTAVHTSTRLLTERMERHLPFVIPQQGRTDNSYDSLLEGTCNGQLPTSAVVDVNAYAKGRRSESASGWDGTYHSQTLSGELIKHPALPRRDRTKNTTIEMDQGLAIKGTYLLPLRPVLTIGIDVNTETCLSRFVY